MLECAICEASYLALWRNTWGCQWNHKRGDEACPNRARARQQELEERVISTIAERILSPENVAYAVEAALKIVHEDLQPDTRSTDKERLGAILKEQDNLARLVARTGRLDVYGALIDELEQERREVEDRLEVAAAEPDIESLRPAVEALVTDLRVLLVGPPVEARAALTQLFGDRKLRIRPDDENGYSIEGIASLDVPMQVHSGAGDPTRPRTCRVKVALAG